MSFNTSRFLLPCLLVLLVVSSWGAEAFVPQTAVTALSSATTRASMVPKVSTSTLMERRWNFNEGQGPWGLKKNAEIWNGRVSQVAFVWVFLQELITGKGVVQGVQEGDLFFLANVGLFGALLLGLTGWLAYQGADDFTKKA